MTRLSPRQRTSRLMVSESAPPPHKLKLIPHLHDIRSTASKMTLGVHISHIPGHRPDELALWDAEENMFCVGDTFYEDNPVIFPEEGDLSTWFAAVDFISKQRNSDNVKINCGHGHATSMKPAIDVLQATKGFITDVVSGKDAEEAFPEK